MKRFFSKSGEAKSSSRMTHIVYGIILVFITIAWIDSNFTYRLARIRFPGGHASDYQVETVGGKLSIIRDVTRSYGSREPGIKFRSGEMWEDESWFPKPRWDVEHHKGFHFEGFIYVPYWLIAIFASGCWIGAFLLRKSSQWEQTMT